MRMFKTVEGEHSHTLRSSAGTQLPSLQLLSVSFFRIDTSSSRIPSGETSSKSLFVFIPAAPYSTSLILQHRLLLLCIAQVSHALHRSFGPGLSFAFQLFDQLKKPDYSRFLDSTSSN